MKDINKYIYRQKAVLILTFTITLINSITTKAQIRPEYSPSAPLVGSEILDLPLNDLRFDSGKEKKSLLDFKDKWLIVVFWTEGCGGCIDEFPKLDSIQKIFDSKIQMLLVGMPYKDGGTIRRLYEKIRATKNINLPIAYDDDGSLYKYMHGTTIIDKEGIIKGRPYEISIDVVGSLLSNANYALKEKKPELDNLRFDSYRARVNARIPISPNANLNVDTGYLFRSVFLTGQPLLPRPTQANENGLFELINFNLYSLYQYAYLSEYMYGERTNPENFHVNPILEVKDRSLFDSLYCYSYMYPKEAGLRWNEWQYYNNVRLQSKFRADLNSYFPYVVTIETRLMPCWKLSVTAQAKEKLKAKKNPADTGNYAAFNNIYRDKPMSDVIEEIDHIKGFRNGEKIVDETGITYNVDVNLQAAYFDDLRQLLADQGLQLKYGKTEMKVIVIRDRENPIKYRNDLE